MTDVAAALGAAATALGAGLAATPAVRALARRHGVVAAPRVDRWHSAPTALFGGVAIAIATVAGLIVWALATDHPGTRVAAPIIAAGGGALLMFAVGVVDDVVRLRAPVKFILQLLAGVGLVAAGATLALTPWYLVNVVATVFWFVALTNAFNLLDNMDGVAAGVAAIAAVFLGVTFAFQGAWLHAAAAWSLAGAAGGFLRYNFHPAGIFMGDAGSLFIGSLLAGLVVTSPASVSGSLVAVLFVPLAIMAVPIADTALVTITRTLAARGIAQGGRDHSTHRLVALGLGERQVALLLYGFAFIGGGIGILLLGLDASLGFVLGAGFLAVLSVLAAYLGRLQVGYPDNGKGWRAATIVATELLYKRRLAAMLLDVVLVAAAYYLAYRLKFEQGSPLFMQLYRSTLGLVIFLKISLLGVFGVYRGAWRYASIVDLYRIIGAVAVSTALLFGYASWRQPLLVPSNILLIDALLCAALVLAARLSFRTLELLRARLRRSGERVAIYGAGDGGELAVREVLNNASLGLNPVCFLDDDPLKQRERIHGVPVIGGLSHVASISRQYDVRRILIATKKLAPDVLRALHAYARQHQLELFELEINVKTLQRNGRDRRVTGVRTRRMASLQGDGDAKHHAIS